jgi:hypothetical protein
MKFFVGKYRELPVSCFATVRELWEVFVCSEVFAFRFAVRGARDKAGGAHWP